MYVGGMLQKHKSAGVNMRAVSSMESSGQQRPSLMPFHSHTYGTFVWIKYLRTYRCLKGDSNLALKFLPFQQEATYSLTECDAFPFTYHYSISMHVLVVIISTITGAGWPVAVHNQPTMSPTPHLLEGITPRQIMEHVDNSPTSCG